MLISLNWLKDYVEIPGKITPEDLGVLLTTHTVEIDGVENQAEKYKNVVVGKILEVSKHPNADKLQLAKVDIGKEKLDIVCGAPNIEPGQLVPVALVGAVLPNGMEIKEAEVRGEKSCGMMCAEDELGLGDDHSGIIILDNKSKVGQNFADYLGFKDAVLEVDNKSITHRPDLWSHYGLAREVSAFLNTKYKELKFDKKILKSSGSKKISCKIEDYDVCPRYMAIAIDGVEIKESPKWIQERLIATGVRPISNIVDITNYVLMELGQPMHAFDADFLGDKIVVRRAKEKEVIETLDGEKRELNKEDIVVTDGKKPVALGGVMGGANSEISDNTKNIIIESANFNYIAIRKTSTKLGLRSESSVRFEKSLDPNLSEMALIRAVELVKELCPNAKVSSNLVDEKKFKLDQGPVSLNLDWLEKSIGQKIEDKKVIDILESLGFLVKKGKGELKVTVPTWRATRDVSIPEDLVEEIARIYGYENIEPVMPKVEISSPEINMESRFERRVKNILSGAPALTETYNYSFVGEKQLKKININSDSFIRLANPITSHQTLLRQSLVPNLLDNVVLNQANFDEIGIFEIGSVYLSTDGEDSKDSSKKEFLPLQEKRLSIVLGGSKKEVVFKEAKGIIEHLLSSFDLEISYAESKNKEAWCDKQVCADIIVHGKSIGQVVLISPQVANLVGIKKKVAVAELNFNSLFNTVSSKKEKKYKQLEKYPASVRDLAFVVESKVLYNDIRKMIKGFDKLINDVELFDVYEGDKLGAGKKSLAFHVTYQADRTLTAEEVDKLQGGLIEKLENKFEAKIRDF